MNPDLIMAAFESELEKIAGLRDTRALDAFEDEIYKLAYYPQQQQQQGPGMAAPVAAGVGAVGLAGAGMYGYNQHQAAQAAQAAAAQKARREAAEAATRGVSAAGPGLVRRMAGMAGKGLFMGGVALGGAAAAGIGKGVLGAVGDVGARTGRQVIETGGKSVVDAASAGGRKAKSVAKSVSNKARGVDPKREKMLERLYRDRPVHPDGTARVNF